MIRQTLRVAFDSTFAGGEIRHGAGWRHVIALALLALFARRAVKPFGIGAVDVYAKHNPFVAGGTIAAVAINGGKRVVTPVHVVERPNRNLPIGRAQELQPEAAVRAA